jgi:hypothetical protein
VWLRRKVLPEWLTGTAGKTHAKSGTVFCLEWGALLELRSCKNGTICSRECPATSGMVGVGRRIVQKESMLLWELLN